MHILITGGAGFIGSHTADALAEKGHKIRILDNLQKNVHPEGLPDYIRADYDFIKGDVRNKEDWIRALDGVEAVYHFAAYQDYLTDFSTFYAVNAFGTALMYEILAEQAGKHGVKKIVVASSQAVIGEGRYLCPSCGWEGIPEIRREERLKKALWEHECSLCSDTLKWQSSDESIANPCNPYALSKEAQEKAAIQLGKREGIDTSVMRYSIVQGARQSFFNAYSGAMRIFCLSLYSGLSPLIFEDGKQIRDFINIEDVVKANLLVLEHPEAKNRVFNVGGSRAYTINEFYKKIQKVTNKNIEAEVKAQYRFGDTRHIFSDTSALQKLGWQAEKKIEESIEEYWEYLNKYKAEEEIINQANKRMKELNVIRDADI